jgi:hypothetical protein
VKAINKRALNTIQKKTRFAFVFRSSFLTAFILPYSSKIDKVTLTVLNLSLFADAVYLKGRDLIFCKEFKMPGARDIALIILCLEALVAGIVPLILLAALAYGVYWLRGKVVLGLRKALEYAELARLKVEAGMTALVTPFIRAYATAEMIKHIGESLYRRYGPGDVGSSQPSVEG